MKVTFDFETKTITTEFEEGELVTAKELWREAIKSFKEQDPEEKPKGRARAYTHEELEWIKDGATVLDDGTIHPPIVSERNKC